MILGKKGVNLDQKGPKWAGLDFSRTSNLNFPKEDHNINFYTNKTQYDWLPGKSQNSKKLKKTRDLQLFLEDRG